VLLNDIPQNGVSVAVSAKAAGGESEIAVSVPGRELLALLKGETRMDVFIYVFDQKKRVAAWTQKTLTIDPARAEELLAANGLTMRASFKLPPGAHVAKAVVWLREPELMGFGRASFDVTP